MVGWGSAISFIMELVNKFVPSRKAALVDELNRLTAEYQKALESGKDTEAAELRKKIQVLRQKADLSEGDV
jgi:protein-arginine kinase activator protein McsA